MTPDRTIAWLAVVMAPLVTLACPNTCPPAAPSPVVGSVEVIPRSVIISAPPSFTTTFQLEARLRTADGAIISNPSSNTLTWPVTGGGGHVSVPNNSGHHAVVQVTLPGGAPVTVAADAGAIVNGSIRSTPDASIQINPPGTGSDTVTAQHAAGAPPSVALLDGVPRSSESCIEMAVSFVGIGPVGDFDKNCEPDSRVAVFSADWSMELLTRPWSLVGDNVRADLVQQPVLNVPVALWIAVADEPEDGLSLTDLQSRTGMRALLDILYTNAVLRTSRAGMTLSVAVGFPKVHNASLDYYSCNAPFATQSGVLNVYYVNSLSGMKNGRSCPRYSAEDRILVSRTRNVATLSHELGHTLALMFPSEGHTNGIRGFDPTNLMTDGLDDLAASGRSYFTLGQLFRMNLDEASWVNQPAAAVRVGRPTLMCQCDPYTRSTCPKLAQDLGSAAEAGAPIDAWQCGDLIRIDGMATEDAAALVSGRVWRTNQCEPSVPGIRYSDRPNAVSIYFANLTRPGTCPSSLSLFFHGHRALFRTIADGPIPWDLWLNQYVIEDHLFEPLKVPVNVWVKDDDATASDRDQAVADQIFSERVGEHSNRTGITFDWKSPPPTTAWNDQTLISGMTSCAIPTLRVLHQINVYYVTDGSSFDADGGFSCANGDTYFIYLPTGIAHPSTALAHHLGKAFGLADVGAADGLGDENVMWFAPILERRTQFTLGQVFRMNFDSRSWLNSGSPSSPRSGPPQYDCVGVDRMKCPALHAGVPD